MGKANEELENLFLLVARKVMKPIFIAQDTFEVIKALDNELAFLSPSKADFGIECLRFLQKCEISAADKATFEAKAFAYLKSLLVEISKRLPKHLSTLKNVQFLSPKVCLNQHRLAFKDLPFLDLFIHEDECLGKMEIQWQKLLTVDWKKACTDLNVLENSYKFWPFVYYYENVGGKQAFKELAQFAL